MLREQAIIVLKLNDNPTFKQIKKAYRKRALEMHPDKVGGDAEKFKLVKEAYDLLMCPVKKFKRIIWPRYNYTGVIYVDVGGIRYDTFGGYTGTVT